MIIIDVIVQDEAGRKHFIRRSHPMVYKESEYKRDEGTIHDLFADAANQYIDEAYYGKS